MKLQTELECLRDPKWEPFMGCRAHATKYDAACAHALMQAKNEVLANVIYHDLRTLIDIRADTIMASLGFDSTPEQPE
jgi:hypothetical protein